MDSPKSPRPKRKVIVPPNARPYLSLLKSRRIDVDREDEQEESQAGEPETEPAGPDPGDATPVRSSKRVSKVPPRAVQSVNERQAGKDDHELRTATKKRKAEALERPNSSQPPPLSDSHRAEKRKKQTAPASILDRSVDELEEDEERIEWYLAAISERDGKDLSGLDWTADMLERTWLHPSLKTKEDDSDNVPGKGKGKQPIIEFGENAYVMEPRMANPTPLPKPKPKPKPLPSLNSTDHTTIMPGALVNPKHLRGVDGKPIPPSLLSKTSANSLSWLSANDLSLTTSSFALKEQGQQKPSTNKSNLVPNVQTLKSDQTAKVAPSAPSKWQLCPSNDAEEHLKKPVKGAPVRRQPSNGQQPAHPQRPTKTKSAPTKGKKRIVVEVSSGEETEQDGDSNIHLATEDEQGNPDQNARLTKRQQAQLGRFGEAIPLVSKLRKIIRLRAITENPFADVTMAWSEADRNGVSRLLGKLSDLWIVEEWDKLNDEMRQNKPHLKLLPEYVEWVTLIFSTVRNDALTALGTSVETTYGLDRNGEPEVNKTLAKDLLPDAFLSPTQTPRDPMAFSGAIFKFRIRRCYFGKPGKGLGFKHPDRFSPMPLPVLALFATLISNDISHYAQGTYRPTPLDADSQVPFYNMYMGLLEEMRGRLKLHVPNLQKRLFDFCHGNTPVKKAVVMQIPELDYGEDSAEEYVSKVIVDKPAQIVRFPQKKPQQRRPTQPPTSKKTVILVSDGSSPPRAGPSGTRHSSLTPQPKVTHDRDGCVEELVFTDFSDDE